MGNGEASDQNSFGIDSVIHRLIYEFEIGYRDGTGHQIEVFLEGVEEEEVRHRLLPELVHSELELRLRAGEKARLEEYLVRFSGLVDTPDALIPLLETELRLRILAGERPAPAEYEACFAGLGPLVPEAFRRAGAVLPVVPGYEVLGVLGRGGMGVVYRARQLALRRDVALKVVRRDRLTADSLGDRYRSRFRREAEAVAALDHPDVVRVYEAAEAGGDLYLAMELVDGPSLQRRLDEGGVLSPREAATLVERVARAVAAVHERGIVHRDLKPDNILLTPLGSPKVADFGLARPAAAAYGQTREGAVVGTPEYMSPEQASGSDGEPTPAADIYGLGAVFYACLSGRPPIPRGPLLETLERVRTQEPPPLRALRPDCPRDLETIALKCLAKVPQRRYASAESLAEDLRRWLDGRPILARRAGLTERTLKWIRRNPSRAVAAATSALAAVAIVLGSLAWAASVAMERSTLQAQLGEARRQADVARISSGRRHWDEAIASVRRAQAGIEERGRPSDLWGEAQKLRAEIETCARLNVQLEEARIAGSATKGRDFDRGRKIAGYRQALIEAGIDPLAADPTRSVARARELGVEESVISAVDDWGVKAEAEDRDRLAFFADRLDDDPDRRRIRSLPAAGRSAALGELAARTDIQSTPKAALESLASALMAAGEFEAARPMLEKAKNRYPDDFWFNHDLGTAWARGPLADLRLAANHFRAAVAQNPRCALAHANLGVILSDRDEWDGAVAAYEEAIRLEEGLALAYKGLGKALFKLHRLPQAAAALRKAVELDPTYSDAHSDLSGVLSDLGDSPGAVEAIGEAIRLQPDNPGYRFNLAYVRRGAGDIRGAIEAERESTRLDPDFDKGNAWLQMGSFHLQLNEFEQAKAALLRSTRLNPAFALGHNMLGQACFATGDLVGAIAAFREAMRRDPMNADFMANYGGVLCLTGNLEGGIAALREAVRRIPDDPAQVGDHPAHLANLAEGLHYHGDPIAAATVGLESVRLAPAVPEGWNTYAMILAATGDSDGAVAAFEEAIRLNRDYAEAHCRLGLVRFGRGEFASSILSLREGHRIGSGQAGWELPSMRWVALAERAAELGDRLSAMEAGKENPVDADDCLGFAEVFYCMNRFAPAARLYSESFRRAPGNLEVRGEDYRFRAACAAVMASYGRGAQDGRKPEPAEAARLRGQALTWLRAELEVMSQTLRTGSTEAVGMAVQALRRWKTSPELAGVRTSVLLSFLPTAERDSWSRFWSRADSAVDPRSASGFGAGDLPEDVFAR